MHQNFLIFIMIGINRDPISEKALVDIQYAIIKHDNACTIV